MDQWLTIWHIKASLYLSMFPTFQPPGTSTSYLPEKGRRFRFNSLPSVNPIVKTVHHKEETMTANLKRYNPSRQDIFIKLVQKLSECPGSSTAITGAIGNKY